MFYSLSLVYHYFLTLYYKKLNQFILNFPENYLKYAHGVVSEYLADDLSAKLHKHLGLPEPETGPNKRKQLTSANTNTDLKRSKTDAQPQEPVKNGALDLSKPEKVVSHPPPNFTCNA